MGCAGATFLFLAGCAVEPKPLTDAERRAEVQTDLKAMFAGQEPLTHPLSLTEAYQRAVKYNLDRRAKQMEEAVAVDGLGVANMDMLPKLTADAGYLSRSNTLAESSTSILTGQQSLQPSTSTDNNRNITGLGFSWNILDFGVSYFAARQSADRVLIALERRRKVTQNLMRDVRSAYWRSCRRAGPGAPDRPQHQGRRNRPDDLAQRRKRGPALAGRGACATSARCSTCCGSSRRCGTG